MTDEKFTFISDVKEKGSIARSSHNKRTHCGKGGCKLPHEYLTAKERKALSGEVKSYRLNDPMKWDEFKYMPDDIKTSYIQIIRERFGVSDSCIAKMLGVYMAKRLGIGLGRGTGNQKSDKEGFLAWRYGAPLPAKENAEEAAEDITEPVEATSEDIAEDGVCYPEPVAKTVPTYGSLTFDCAAGAALETIGVLLGGSNVHITVTWEVRPEDEAVGNG